MGGLSFYVDSCIYLNWWKKELGSIFKKPFWKTARKFFEKVEQNKGKVYYSGFILKELYYKLTKEEFIKKKNFIESSPNYFRITLNQNEYEYARKIERKLNFAISFYDIIHMTLTKKTNSILITRDKELLKSAKKFGVIARKPEEIIH